MQWLFFASLAYFILALTQVLDKFLLGKKIPQPSVYAFYVALLGLFSLFLIPLGFRFPSYFVQLVAISSGVVFVYAILFFYRGVKESELSRIAPLMGTVASIVTFLLAVFFEDILFQFDDLIGVFFLVIGGLLISFDLPIKSRKIFSGFGSAFWSGIFLAIAYFSFEKIFQLEGFINGFMWTRIGLAVGGVSLLLFPVLRREILTSLKVRKITQKENAMTVGIFVCNKVLAGVYSILVLYAISLGSAAFVQAAGSLQYIFVLMIVALFSVRYPEIFQEKLAFWDWFQKVVAIIIVGIGLILISL